MFQITNNLHNSAFPSFNLSMFAEEDGTSNYKEDKIILIKEKY